MDPKTFRVYIRVIFDLVWHKNIREKEGKRNQRKSWGFKQVLGIFEECKAFTRTLFKNQELNKLEHLEIFLFILTLIETLNLAFERNLEVYGLFWFHRFLVRWKICFANNLNSFTSFCIVYMFCKKLWLFWFI